MILNKQDVLIGEGLKLGLQAPSYIGLLGFKVLEPDDRFCCDIAPEAYMVYVIIHAKTPLLAWKKLTKYGVFLQSNCHRKSRITVKFTGICDMLPVYEGHYTEYIGQGDEVLDQKYSHKFVASKILHCVPGEEELKKNANVSIMPGFRSNGMYLKDTIDVALKTGSAKHTPYSKGRESYVAMLVFTENLSKDKAIGKRKCRRNDMIRLYFADSVDDAIKMAQDAGKLEETICEDFPNMPRLYFYGIWGICKVNKHPATLCELFHLDYSVDGIQPVDYQTVFDRMGDRGCM